MNLASPSWNPPDSGLGAVLDNKSPYYLNQGLFELLAATGVLTDAAASIMGLSVITINHHTKIGNMTENPHCTSASLW